MDKQKLTVKANEVFDIICKTFDKCNYEYKRDDKDLSVAVGLAGKNMPTTVILNVLADRESIYVVSPLPFKVDADKRVEAAVATCILNDRVFNGTYNFDMNDGSIVFKTVVPYMDMEVSERLIVYLVALIYSTVDMHNDLLHSLAKGMITVEQFFEEVSK